MAITTMLHATKNAFKTLQVFNRGLGGYFPIIASLLVVAGCFSSHIEEPIDNDELNLIIRGRFAFASIGKAGEPYVVEIQDEVVGRNILSSLEPIRSVKVGTLPDDSIDYRFSYQSGRNPIVFLIHISDDHLVFQDRKWLYEAGSAKAFKCSVKRALKGETWTEKVSGTFLKKKPRESSQD